MEHDPDTATRLSVVLPVIEATDGLNAAIAGYCTTLGELGVAFEVILVGGSETAADCGTAAAQCPSGRVVSVECESWGRCVRAGLAGATGDILCYANWQRTSAASLTEMIGYALRDPDLVLRSNRRTRDTLRQRLGSLLFNLECRALLGITAWDVNGTPKVFGRHRSLLLELRRDDDLIDAEFAVVCEQAGYPVAEIPIDSTPLYGHVAPPDYPAALHMYAGVPRLKRDRRSRPPSLAARAGEERAGGVNATMARDRSPWWSILDTPWVWNALRVGLDVTFGLHRRRMALVRSWGLVTDNPSLLDVGCGIGQYASLTNGKYLGVDLTERYIQHARIRADDNPNREFRVADVETLSLEGRDFDLVLLVDFLHHIDDTTARRLLRSAGSLARRYVISLEPVHEQDNRLGRWIIDHDRGDYMRTLNEYHALLEASGLEIVRSEPLALGPIGTRAVLAATHEIP